MYDLTQAIRDEQGRVTVYVDQGHTQQMTDEEYERFMQELRGRNEWATTYLTHQKSEKEI